MKTKTDNKRVSSRAHRQVPIVGVTRFARNSAIERERVFDRGIRVPRRYSFENPLIVFERLQDEEVIVWCEGSDLLAHVSRFSPQGMPEDRRWLLPQACRGEKGGSEKPESQTSHAGMLAADDLGYYRLSRLLTLSEGQSAPPWDANLAASSDGRTVLFAPGTARSSIVLAENLQ